MAARTKKTGKKSKPVKRKAAKPKAKPKPASPKSRAKSRPRARAPKTTPIPAPVHAWGAGPLPDKARERLLAAETARIDRLRRELGESIARFHQIERAPAPAPEPAQAPPSPKPRTKPKAKKAPALKPRPWFAKAAPVEQARDLEYLRRTTKDLREFYSGFEERDGYKLDRVPEWPAAKVEKVRRMGEDLHALQSRASVKVVPDKKYRDKKKRSALKKELRRLTGQNHPDQKAWLYPTDGRRIDVSLNDRGRLEERTPITGSYIKFERWYFRDYTRDKKSPVTEAGFQSAAKRMLKVIPAHFFISLFNERDVIDAPFEAMYLPEKLTEYFDQYKQLNEWLLGVIHQGSRSASIKSFNARVRRREIHQYEKSKAGKLARKRRSAYLKRLNRGRKEFGDEPIAPPKKYTAPKSVKKEKPIKKHAPSVSPALRKLLGNEKADALEIKMRKGKK